MPKRAEDRLRKLNPRPQHGPTHRQRSDWRALAVQMRGAGGGFLMFLGFLFHSLQALPLLHHLYRVTHSLCHCVRPSSISAATNISTLSSLLPRSPLSSTSNARSPLCRSTTPLFTCLVALKSFPVAVMSDPSPPSESQSTPAQAPSQASNDQPATKKAPANQTPGHPSFRRYLQIPTDTVLHMMFANHATQTARIPSLW